MTATRAHVGRYAAWLAALLLSLYVVFVGGGWSGVYIAELRAASVALATGALAIWFLAAWRVPAWRPRSVLLAPGALLLVAFAFATAFSRYPRISVEYLGYALIAAALYLLLVRLLADPFLRARFGALALLLCGAISTFYIVQVGRHWVDWWGTVGRFTVPPLRPDSDALVWGTPSAVLTIVVLFGAAGVAHVGTDTRPRRAVVGLLVALAATTSLLTGSRAGWFALGVALVITSVLVILSPRGRTAIRAFARGVTRPGRARIAFAAMLVIVAVALVALAPALLRRASEGGEDLRVAYVAAALRMFAEAPLVGTGPGTWVVQRIRYTVPPETDYYIPHAHDIYAQTLSELGVVGAAAGLLLVVTLAWLVRGAMRDPDPVRRRWGWLTAFALLYLGAHQLLDFYANMPAVLFAAALPVAWLDATAPRAPVLDRYALPMTIPRALAVTGVAFLLVATVGLELSQATAITHERAVAAGNSGDWAAADPLVHQAATGDPDVPPYHLTEGLAAARSGDRARAAEAFRRVVDADDLPEAWLDLAAEQAALGDPSAALGSIQAALRLGYQRPAVALPAGDLSLRLGSQGAGSETLATAAFIDAMVGIPSLTGDPWWTADPDRAALFPSLRTAAIARAGPAVGWEIALVSGDYIGARSLAEQLDPAQAVYVERIIDAWSGAEAGRAAVLDDCAAHPLDVARLAWCARIEGHFGNDGEANRYRAWANTIVGNAFMTGAELRVNPNPQVGRTGAGNPALFYGYYTYLRPTPWDLLVPDLVHLTLE